MNSPGNIDVGVGEGVVAKRPSMVLDSALLAFLYRVNGRDLTTKET